MEYRVLGPLEVVAAGGEKLALGGAMQQSVLASLLLRAGRTVALERLVDDLWDEPPETAARTIQAYVSRLRHELPDGAIESDPGGYRLVLDGAELDLEMFEQLAEEGHTALAGGEFGQAAGVLRQALDLWHGPALVGLNSEALRREAQRLEELRLTVLEDRIEADLGCGRHAELVAELTAVVDEHPFRERPRAQLMRALYYSGRPGDALALYRDGRRMLVEELGMEPGQALRELEQAILRQDAELETPPGPERPTPAIPVSVAPVLRIARRPTREVRKTVTVLFCDVVDSTGQGESTDPEVVRSRLARFFEQMKMIVDRHGGTVEKFIGDAVMAVFGVPRAHEDDALRACRAAIEMREALPSLGIEGRIGLTTGEVVTGTEERLATGDAVNVAARLEQAAGPGEVLIGEPTLELVREADVDELEPLELKGKKHPVRAYRLKGVRDSAERPVEPPFVGRERELAAIRAAWERALTEQRCQLFTVVGEAGIGKSRLVAEALDSVEGLIVQGRCLPYGEGITYWPVVEVIKQLGAPPADPVAASAIASLLGGSESGPTLAEEIASAFRKLLEERAPLVVVFDDIQWGEETFLDLLEHVALLSTESPILLLCIARPEIAEEARPWPATLSLEPLPDAAVDELIGSRVAADVGAQIATAAGGNPLFVAEMLTMTQQTAGKVTVPPTLRALLAARLDQLDNTERSVLERASVEGEIFHLGAVRALGPEETQVTPQLASLVRKGLIRPEKSGFQNENGFRFRHLLLRDAVYDSLPKAKRARLHERFAAWLEERAFGRPELDEMLGYHLERAYRYREELGLVGQHERELAQEAMKRLEAAGRKALHRGDAAAASGLLERAISLLARDDPVRLGLLPMLATAFFEGGRLADADRVLAEAVEGSTDELLEARARVEQQFVRLQTYASAVDDAQHVADAAVKVFEEHEDDAGQSRAWCLKATIAWFGGQAAQADQAWQRAAEHALRATDTRAVFDILDWRASAALVGPTPVDEAIEICLQIRDQVRSSPVAMAETLYPLAALHAMRGEFDTAHGLIHDGNAILIEELGRIYAVGLAHHQAVVAMLAGEPEAAEECLRQAYESFTEMGEKTLLASTAAYLAQAIYAQDRPEEASHFSEVSRDVAVDEDLAAQVVGRGVSAKILARQGRGDEAEVLAREAVELAGRTDFLTHRGDAFLDLAEVLELNERSAEAESSLRAGLELFERKGDVVSSERARKRLEQVRSACDTRQMEVGR